MSQFYYLGEPLAKNKMSKFNIDLSVHVVYKHIPSDCLIAFDLNRADKIRKTLSKHGKIFHQVPEEEKITGQVLAYNQKIDTYYLSGDWEVLKIQDLDNLPLLTKLAIDFKRLFGTRA